MKNDILRGNFKPEDMSKPPKIQAIRFIIERFMEYPYQSIEDLKQGYYDRFDCTISDRSVQRHITTIRDEYFINVKSSRGKGYSIDKEDDELYEDIKRFMNFMDLMAINEIYEAGSKDYKAFNELVILEDKDDFSGIGNLSILLRAIKDQYKIAFTKVNYLEGTTKDYVVSPIRIKQFAQRWYLIGVPEGEKEIRNFGIDRISNIKLLAAKAKVLKSHLQQIKQYNDVVGLNYSDADTVQSIVLKAHKDQLKYLRSLRIHHSQKCIDPVDGGDWGEVHFSLKPNFEFEMQILKLGENVEVVKPAAFRKKISQRIQMMYDKYQ